MPLLDSPSGRLESLVTGTGEPTTVFAHGVGASIAETRPLGRGVAGRRVFFHFRGHGRSPVPAEGWDYAGLAAELRAVADSTGATRAVGVSMGAGALARLVADTPDRFQRLVFLLPADLDRPRPGATVRRLAAMADAVDAGDVERLVAMLRHDAPPAVRDRPEVEQWLRARAVALVGTPVSRLLRTLPSCAPVVDRRALAAVTAPALVVGHRGDPVHPAEVARALAAALPSATLQLHDDPGALWSPRSALPGLLSAFLRP